MGKGDNGLSGEEGGFLDDKEEEKTGGSGAEASKTGDCDDSGGSGTKGEDGILSQVS